MTQAQAPFVARPVTAVPPRETPPRRGGSRPPQRPRASLETQIGSMLTAINLVLLSVPQTRNDAMDPYEITALAKAIDQQAKQSPRFRKYLEAMLAAGSGAGLAGVVVMIGARRLARHGVLQAEIDPLIGSLFEGSVKAMPSTGAPTRDTPITTAPAGAAA